MSLLEISKLPTAENSAIHLHPNDNVAIARVPLSPGQKLKLGGPLLDDEGAMAGSLIIFEADTVEEAWAFSNGDPYVQAGLFAHIQVLPFRMTLQNLT